MDKSTRDIEPFRPHEPAPLKLKNAGRRSTTANPCRIASEQPISVRFEPEMIERLDRVATRLSKLNLNIRIGRSSVVKLALERALDGLETELAIVRPRANRPLRPGR